MAIKFDSTKDDLEEILKDIGRGKIQLPDFQRGWIWDDDRVRSLLASVAVSFPIGTLMMLTAGGESIKLQPRPIEGAPTEITKDNLETLILDGQQRMTSLYQALMRKESVATNDSKNRKIKRFYYIDMKNAIDKETDLEEAIVSVPEDRVQKGFGANTGLDLSTPDMEYKKLYFPVNALLDADDWRREYNKFWQHSDEKTMFFDKFNKKIIDCFKKYQVPIIKLGKDTPKEAVCLVFEKVNTGGVSLTVFELLTATFAADNFNLRKDWNARKEVMIDDKSGILTEPDSDHFLQAISLLVSLAKRDKNIAEGIASENISGISCKRREILNLGVDEYNEWADKVQDGFIKAARFLNDEKIFSAKDVPYKTQLVPLATILVALGNDGEPLDARGRISRWYWCGILGELYGGAIETRFALDLPQVVEFVRGGDTPKTITDANFAPRRLLTLRTRNSAAYKGIYALLMCDGCCDFRTGKKIESQVFHNEAIDIHHIFPQKWCEDSGDNRITKDIYNSIINKTAISSRTNRIIGGKAPSEYSNILEERSGVSSEDMDKLFSSHGINPESVRGDDYWSFYKDRAEHLLNTIERATQMEITRDENLFSGNPQDYEDEGE